jgi:hypothetical protein
VQELQDLLQQNMRTLDAARLALDDMVHSYPAYASKELDTVASAIGSEDSVLGDRDSVVSSTRFAFDDICFTSKPYRQTVARVLGKKASKKTSGKASVSVPVPPDLPSVKEAEAVTASEPRDRTANPVPPTGVSAEEYEAVVAKLREAEALIQQLQERMRQSAPFKAKETEQPATLPAGERVPLAEDAGEEAPEPAAKSDGKGPSIPKVSYAVPDDEASTTIISGNTKVSRPSQKSLLIEYFEGGKPQGTENSGTLKPSVRVRVTPSGIKHMQNGQHTSSSTVRRKRRYPKRERRTPSPVPEDEDQPLHEPAAANTVSESAISSIPPSSFLDGPEPPSTVRQSRDPAEPAGVRPVPGALCEEAKKPLRMTARELREKARGDDLHSEIRHQEKLLARKERSYHRSGHRRLSTGGLTLYDAVEEEERWSEWPSRAVKVPREKERRNGKQRREEGIEELEELYERIERLENQWLEDERLLKEQREIRERLRNNRVSPKSQPLPTAPSPRADDDPAWRPSIEKIKETVRALEQVDELAGEAERLDALYRSQGSTSSLTSRSTPGTDDEPPQDASWPRLRPKKWNNH